MKVFVYGKNSDDKGTQLEALTASILKGMGYVVTRNEVKAGGNELDVVATKKEPFGGNVCLICECKAQNSLITMNDWLKFIGKLYLEKRKNQMTYGLMIALSGANGNVLGSFDDIKQENFITLITNEALLRHIRTVHPMVTEKQVMDDVRKYTRKDILDTNVIYYNGIYYWHICLPNGEYTLLKEDLSSIDDDLLNPFKAMIESQSDCRFYIDIKEEYQAIQRRSFIKSLILSYTLDEDHSLQEITNWINSIRKGFNVSYVEVQNGVSAIPYLRIKDDTIVSVINEEDIDFIKFYRFILSDTVSTKVMATRFYKNHINETLLEGIRELQHGIQIPSDSIQECLFLLRHSPTALAYSIYEDEALTRYRNPDKAVYSELEKAHTEWFLDHVMNGFIVDYNRSELSEYYLDTERLSSIEIHTDLKIFKDNEAPIEIHHYKAECLGRLSEEYGNQVALLIKLPE